MNAPTRFVSTLLLSGLVVSGGIVVFQSAAGQTQADATTNAVVAAANGFLATLSAAEQAKVKFPFVITKASALTIPNPNSPNFSFVGEQYGQSVWSNYPVSDVPRPGIKLGEMSAAQQTAALNLIKAALSPEGYQKIVDIMDADQILSATGTPYDDGRAFYGIGLFGTPSPTSPWMIQYGGHHLGLNIVVVGSNIAITPTLTGDQPASYQRDGQTVRPLGKEIDLALKLMNALSAQQRTSATLSYQISDLVLGPGQDGKVLQPEGIKGSSLTAAQKDMLLELTGAWVGMLKTDDAAPKLAQIKANIDDTYFAWRGEISATSPVYFRVTGPTVHIEFAHQMNTVNHIHTVYRDPTNEYGAVWTK